MFHMEDSVWSSLPPINISSLKPPKPIILTVASMDSASFFRDKSLGADSPISVRTTTFTLLFCIFGTNTSVYLWFVLKSNYNDISTTLQGLIALLAAVDTLSHLDGLGDLSKQVRANESMDFFSVSVLRLFITKALMF